MLKWKNLISNMVPGCQDENKREKDTKTFNKN